MIDYMNWDKYPKATLEELVKDERKILLMYKLSIKSVSLITEPEYVQRFFIKYSDAYDEYIRDMDNIVKLAMLVAKDIGKLTEEEYQELIYE